MADADGVPIVLTADRSLMADYDVLFDAMVACSQTTTVPWPVMDRLLLPRAPHPDGRALIAPLGLRRIEAALIQYGFQLDEIAVVDDAHLHPVIGPNTRVIGVSSGEPTGMGMSSTTMARVCGGQIYPQALFADLMEKAGALTDRRAPNAAVVYGGPGAWQCAQRPDIQRRFGIDHVICGYAEANAPACFMQLREGHQLPRIVEGEDPPADRVPPVRGATTMGAVEISRGCGLGCDFCAIADVPMKHMPSETIMSDIRTNLSAGVRNICLLSEDVFRYGGRGLNCDPQALLGLLEKIRADDGVRLIQLDHASIAGVSQYSEGDLATMVELLGVGPGDHYPWVNLGVESASGRLVAASGCRAKMAGVSAEQWGEFCRRQLLRLSRAGFVPLISLVVGLPDETEQDVRRTLEWVRSLRGQRVAIFPVVHAPVGGEPAPELTPPHWRLIKECYEFNFKWVPRIYGGNQAAAGTSILRRLLLQVLARLNVIQWRYRLARRLREAR